MTVVDPTDSNGGWFCVACHSLNRPSAIRCYSCGAPATCGAIQRVGRSSRAWIAVGSTLLGLAILAGLVVGRSITTSAATPATTPARLAAAGSGSPLPTDVASLGPATTPRPTPPRTPRVTPSATPAATPSPTATPTTRGVTPPPDATVALPVIPLSIRGVAISTYPISGSTASSLIDAMSAAGPKACNLSEALACFHPKFVWTYRAATNSQTGVCSVTSVDFAATYFMSFPKWTAPSRVSAALATWWKRVMDHFVWHESQHLAIAREYATKLEATIRGGPCSQAAQNKRTDALQAQLEAAQDAFDAEDHSWAWPPL